MRIIPKKTKISTEFFPGVSLADILVGFFGLLVMMVVLLSALPWKLWIEIGLLFVFGLLLVRIDEEPNYMFLLKILRHCSYRRRYRKPEPQAEGKKARKDGSFADIHKLTLVSKIEEELIHYSGQYYGAVIEIPAVEFRFFSPTRRSNAIDRALGSVIRNVSNQFAANLVKLERPMILDSYIREEHAKIEALKRSYERGVFSEEELKARIEIINDRIASLSKINDRDQVLVPCFYLALFDSDKRQLNNQVRSALSALDQGEMVPRRLNDQELALFLRYSNCVDFDERQIGQLENSDYIRFLLPEKVEMKGRTTEINGIVTHNFRVVSYPLSVEDAWGAELFDLPGTKVVMKLTQMDRTRSIRSIDRSISELRSQLEKTSISSRVLEIQTHIETLSELLTMLQNHNESLIAVNTYVTAYDIAYTREYKPESQQPPPSVLPRISGMKKDLRRNYAEQGFKLSDLTFEQFEGYVATQINGYDPFASRARGIPSSTVAAVFPWIYANLQDEKGLNLGSTDGVPTFVDFFRRDSERVNSNMVIIGKSGSGKSYATKSILANLAADDTKIFVLDPENEYTELAANLNGKYINVANASQGRINPFQIITSLEDDERQDGEETTSYAAHLQFLEEFFRQILPEVDGDSMEYLNNLINRVYMRRNIDQYTNLSTLKPEDYPVFDDLYDCILEEFQRTRSDYLKSNLRVLMNYVAKFSTGGRNSGIWNGPSTLSTAENFTVFNFQSLLANRNNMVANAQMLLVLKYLDNEIIKNREYNLKYGAKRKIVIVIDEAHVFIDAKYPLALDFMFQLAKRIRKYNGMQIVITQNIKDFVGSEELARKSTAIINACQYSFIFSLSPNDMHDLCTLYEKAGGINESEQEQIVSAARGNAFVVTSPTNRARIQIQTPGAVEEMFTRPGYESHYFGGEEGTQAWEELLSDSRTARQGWEQEQQVAEPLRQEQRNQHWGGVELLEIEEEELLQVLPEEPVPAPAPAVRQPLLIEEEEDDGPFSAEALQRYGFEAILGEIRRSVREEVEKERGQTGAPAVAAQPVIQPASQPVPEPAPEPIPSSLFDDLFQPTPAAVPQSGLFGSDLPAPSLFDSYDPIPVQDDLFAPAPAAQPVPAEPALDFDDLFADLFSAAPVEVPEAAPGDFEPVTEPEEEPAAQPEEVPAEPEVFEVSLDDLLDMTD